MTLRILSGPILFETTAEESPEEFKAAVESEILEKCYSEIPEWLEFVVSEQQSWNGRIFRAMECPAGSVYAKLILLATSKQGLPRAMLSAHETGGRYLLTLIEEGVEKVVDGEIEIYN